jgi:Tfp pilus assembly protein PilF
MDEDYAVTLSSLGTLNLALFQRQRERKFHTRAVEFYQRAIAEDPEIATAYNGLAVAFRYQNKNDQAVSLWKKALEIKPDFTNVYINLGITLIAIGERAEALEYLTLCRERYFCRLDEAEQTQLQELIERAK